MCSVQKSGGWSRLQISLHGSKKVKKDESYSRDIIMMDSGNTIHLFANINMIKNRLKAEIPMNLMNNAGSKIVSEVGEISGSGQKNSIQR